MNNLITENNCLYLHFKNMWKINNRLLLNNNVHFKSAAVIANKRQPFCSVGKALPLKLLVILNVQKCYLRVFYPWRNNVDLEFGFRSAFSKLFHPPLNAYTLPFTHTHASTFSRKQFILKVFRRKHSFIRRMAARYLWARGLVQKEYL